MKDEIKTKSSEELAKDLNEKRESLRGMRFNLAGSKIKNVKEQNSRKKEIARILTELNARKA